MPTTKSAKKRLRQSLERRARNRSVKASLKTYMRRVKDQAAAGDVGPAGEALKLAAKKLDQAAAKGVIHKNAAARFKSRLSARVKAAKAKTSAPA
jgi:small subunit ribosomal protein S20